MTTDQSDDEKAPEAPTEDAPAADSVRDRELEPVSLRDIEMILAPGRPPPPMVVTTPTAKGAERRPPPAAPRKRLPSLPTAPAKPPAAPVAKGEDSAIEDLRALAGLHKDKPDDRKVDLDAIFEMGTATASDARSSKPDIDRASDRPPPPAPAAGAPPRAKPRPPLKSRPSIPDEQEVATTEATVRPETAEKASSKNDGAEETKAPTSAKRKSVRPSGASKSGPPSKRPSARPAEPRSTAATAASTAPKASEEKPSGSRMPWIIGAGAIVAAGVVYFARSGSDTPPTTTPTATATATAVATANAKMGDAPTSTATEAPTETAPTSVASTEATSTATSPTHVGTSPIAGTAPISTSTSAVTATATATPTAKPPPTGGGGEFDKSAASAALGGGVGAASGCKQPGDPSGTARVQITFAPSGHVTTANISGPPFAGTPTGSCIARAFKSVTVPPFSGGPVTVSKSVSIP